MKIWLAQILCIATLPLAGSALAQTNTATPASTNIASGGTNSVKPATASRPAPKVVTRQMVLDGIATFEAKIKAISLRERKILAERQFEEDQVDLQAKSGQIPWNQAGDMNLAISQKYQPIVMEYNQQIDEVRLAELNLRHRYADLLATKQ